MSEPLAKLGQAVDIPHPEAVCETSQKRLLVETRDVQVVQFIIPAGEGIPTYEAQGELVLHCLQGQVSISALGMTRSLKSGQLIYLSTNEPFSVRGLENASLLATIIKTKQGGSIDVIGE